MSVGPADPLPRAVLLHGTRALATRLPSRRPLVPLLALPVVLAALLVNLPLLYLFLRAGQRGSGFYLRTVLAPGTLVLLRETLLLVAGVVAFSLVLALPLAWLVVRTDLPGRRVWAVLVALPLAVPSYVAALSLIALLGPRGVVQGWLQQPFGVSRLPELCYGYRGALLALGLFTYPYIYLPAVAGLRALDPALEECSRSLGRGPRATLFKIVLPQLRAPLSAGALLVALYTLSDFGAVSLVRYNTLTLGIYNAYTGLFDRTVAACLATVLVFATGALVIAQGRLLRSARPTRNRPSRPFKPTPLGRFKWPCLALLGTTVSCTVGIPAALIAFWGMRAAVQGQQLQLAWGAARNALITSALAALACAALALPLASGARSRQGRIYRLAERLSYSGSALPGLITGLALVFIVTRALPMLYQSVGLVILAYVIRFLPEAVATVKASFAGLAPVFEEAARSLGRGPLAALATVVFPLIRPGLLAGAGLVFLTSMKELPATLILRPAGYETLATRIWGACAEGAYSEAALPSLLLLVACAAPVYLLIIRPMLAERS